MLLNSEKTKNMIFNFTNDYQFTTRMGLHNKNIEVLDSTKLLGTIISNDLKWDLNSKEIVRKGKGSHHKKKRSNLGKSPNREGGRSTPLNPIPNLLTVFSKNT